MTREESITWVGQVSVTRMPSAHVYIGHNRLDTPTPRSQTAVDQRRDTTAATWATAAPSRGATTTPNITGRTAELIIVVCIPTHTFDTNTKLT